MKAEDRLQQATEQATARLKEMFRIFCREQRTSFGDLVTHVADDESVTFLFDDRIPTKMRRGACDALRVIGRRLENITFDAEALAFRLTS